jgi:hypothetical protein
MQKKLYAVFAVWSLSIVLAAPLFAQVPETFTAKIPFDFVVGKRTFPAGEYVVQPSGLAMQIRHNQGKELTWVLTYALTRPMESRDGSFQFHRYGETYFLDQVWRPGTNFGYQLHQSPLEREIAKRTPGPKIESVIAAQK